jgi:hypothetical protein
MDNVAETNIMDNLVETAGEAPRASTQGDVSVVNNDGDGEITSDGRKKLLSDGRKKLLSEKIFQILRHIININFIKGKEEITKKVKNLLKGRELSLETYNAVNEFLYKMKTKVNNKGIFVFEIHDTIGYFVRDASRKRCDNIDDFLSLIRGLVEYINNPPKQNVDFKDEPLFTHTATIAIGDGFNNSNKACGTHLANIEVVNGGSKSRRKPARKTRRGHTRTRKSKPKTHRRKRHSRVRVRKHKKYTSRRR